MKNEDTDKFEKEIDATIRRNNIIMILSIVLLIVSCVNIFYVSLYRDDEELIELLQERVALQDSAIHYSKSYIEDLEYMLDKCKHEVYKVQKVSYYGEDFQNKPTASGEPFNMYALTAAHRTLPFGTILKVTNVENKKFVKVRVNDRGPFVEGRILDLSKAAFKEIADPKKGIAKCTVQLEY